MVAGVPTAASAYFDPEIMDLNTELGQNIVVHNLRDGNILLMNDSRPRYPISGNLLLASTHVDEKSQILIGGKDVYLCPTLRWAASNNLNIVVFHQSIASTHKKAYLCRIIELDPVIETQTSDYFYSRMHLSRMNMPKILSFHLAITKDGLYTNFNAIASVVWINRFA
jgi:hypothetical protein